MNRILPVALAALAALPAQAARLEAPPAPYVEGEILVRYRDSGTFHKSKRGLGLEPVRRFERLRVEQLRLPAFLDVRNAVWLLREDPSVEFAEPNFLRTRRAVVPNDPLFGDQWGLRNTGQANFFSGGPPGVAGGDLNLAEAWDANGDGAADRVGDPSVVIAVIDDAVDVDHPDLAANVVPGRDFVCNDDDPRPDSEDDPHGTWVAGCAAGQGGNALGVAGVAWRASLMPLRFGFDTASHIAALEFARGNGAHIINASFGGPGFSSAELAAIRDLADDGILYVASAGNDDSNTDLAQLNYPANYDADNIVAVAATNRQDDIASFSQYGPLTTDVAAPGLQVVTTSPGGGFRTNPGVSGTSFSSPYIAGVAALLRSHVSPTPGYREMRARLIESGTSVPGANPRVRTTGGRVDADVALEMAPRPTLVLRSVRFLGGDGDNALDPGESLDVEFTVENLWEPATGVTATLEAGSDISVAGGSQSLGSIASGATTTATFPITVESGLTGHRYVTFALTLSADGGYSAQRHYIAEVAALAPGVPVVQAFEDSLYDDFHAWHVDVPAGSQGKTLVIRTSTSVGKDIDLLVRHADPPVYNITVGINPEEDPGFFCTGGTQSDCMDPDTLVSGRIDGTEAVTVVNPAEGAWHLVVVDFVQEAIDYQLQAELLDGDLRPNAFSFAPKKATFGTPVFSDTITVSGIDAPTFITVAGGTYRVNNGAFTGAEGTVRAGDQVQLRAIAADNGRTQLTIGGVTETFVTNPSAVGGGGGGAPQCEPTGGSAGGGSGGGGGALGLLTLAGLAPLLLRRRKPSPGP